MFSDNDHNDPAHAWKELRAHDYSKKRSGRRGAPEIDAPMKKDRHDRHGDSHSDCRSLRLHCDIEGTRWSPVGNTRRKNRRNGHKARRKAMKEDLVLDGGEDGYTPDRAKSECPPRMRVHRIPEPRIPYFDPVPSALIRSLTWQRVADHSFMKFDQFRYRCVPMYLFTSNPNSEPRTAIQLGRRFFVYRKKRLEPASPDVSALIAEPFGVFRMLRFSE